MKNRQKKINIIFLITIGMVIFGSFFKILFFEEKINYYENRKSYTLPKFSIEGFIKKDYQDNLELAVTDQIPKDSVMKKTYNMINHLFVKEVSNIVFAGYCKNHYVYLNNGITTFGCDGNLVYGFGSLKGNQKAYDKRIESINNTILKYPNLDFYIYYIEKDTDVNLITNEKSGVFEYLSNQIKLENINRFEINNFKEFKKYFYKTDHHWNYKGSYKAYKQLVGILTSEQPLVHGDTKLVSTKFTGSKASVSGSNFLYKEDFKVYYIELPEHKTYINGKKVDYGNEEQYLSNKVNSQSVSYGSYYGFDDGEIIFDYNAPEKDNILIVGESYDNAIIEMIASHFNKTHSIDLRNYERENDKKFVFADYINENDITKVLLIGNVDYFTMSEFNLEES